MKKLLFALTILLMALFGCQNGSSEDENDGGFLWKAENGDTTVYLQGTIHLGNESFYPLNDQIENAYEESDVVLPEIDLNEIDVEASQTMIMELATYEGGETIRDDLTEDVFSSLEEILQDNSMEIEMVQHFKPWYFEMMLMQFVLAESDYSAEYAVDSYFLDRAVEDGKEILELENYEDQLTMLAGFSDDIQLEMLENSITNYDSMGTELDELVTHWQNGAHEELRETTEEGETIDGYEEYMEEMNTNRNIEMADTILELLAEDSEQTYFVIVGAMHMIEEPSIVSLLEDGGYDVDHIY